MKTPTKTPFESWVAASLLTAFGDPQIVRPTRDLLAMVAAAQAAWDAAGQEAGR